MDDGLKQRLVGAIVIVAAAIIFVPMIFNETESQSEDIKVEIPPRPEPAQHKLVKPQRPAVEKAASKIKPTKSPENVEKGSQDALPTAWVLQLASFKERKNGDALRDKLRAAGYNSYVTYRANKDDAMARVFVGPELDRKKMEQLRTRLKKEFKLEGFILRYMPE